jgi:hypothetical protein
MEQKDNKCKILNVSTNDSRSLEFQGLGHFTSRETEFELRGSDTITLKFVQTFVSMT